MKIAVIGAGFSGLAVAWKLIESARAQVTLFDARGVGGGASGIASGLMHPYVGEQARRSFEATEGLAATGHLLSQVEVHVGCPVACFGGIVRRAQTEEQQSALLKHCQDYGDVEALGGNAFWIRSGVTVHCRPYLEGLFSLIAAHGGKLERVHVEHLSALSGFDAIVIAAGHGVARFPECRELQLKFTKGQVLTAKASEQFTPLEHSLIGKGYIALGESPGTYHLGSTYEKGFVSETPCQETAERLILSKIGSFFPQVSQLEIIGCSAGIRVIRPDHYFPIMQQLDPRCWVLTALGSRGLLYHALLAQRLIKNFQLS